MAVEQTSVGCYYENSSGWVLSVHADQNSKVGQYMLEDYAASGYDRTSHSLDTRPCRNNHIRLVGVTHSCAFEMEHQMDAIDQGSNLPQLSRIDHNNCNIDDRCILPYDVRHIADQSMGTGAHKTERADNSLPRGGHMVP